jgi:hypothetical protein
LGKVKKELAKKYRYWLMMDDRCSGLGMTIHDVSMEVALECQTEHGDSGWIVALKAKKEHKLDMSSSSPTLGAEAPGNRDGEQMEALTKPKEHANGLRCLVGLMV